MKLNLAPTSILLGLLSVHDALGAGCTVRFYENEECTKTPGWPAFECGSGTQTFPGGQYAQVENNCGNGQQVHLTLTKDNGDGTGTSGGDVWDSGCQSIDAGFEPESFSLVCA